MSQAGFTGTQQGMTSAQLASFDILLARLRPERFRHGDCVGSDEQAHDVALRHQIPITIHPPVKGHKRAFCQGFDEILEPLEYLQRNRIIVFQSTYLIATPSGLQVLRSGTWSTIRFARKNNRPVYIVWPWGQIDVP